jgi:Na+/proline symporter
MTWIDWIIVLIPILIVAYNGLRAQKYVKGVADFLAGGRVAGRYVLTVASDAAASGLVSLVAMFEVYYLSGFAYGFWGNLVVPIGMVLALTGYCVYRFRETRVMTMGQFLEIRYSRSFRIFAATLLSISGVVNYALFPAVGARFLVYFCDLPLEITVFGWVFPTFALVMAAFLSVAVFVATRGGQITIMVTDCMLGLISYPLYMLIAGYLIWRFSWFDEMAPTLLDRPSGKSLLNPFDIKGLRDFNLFFIAVGIFGNILNKMGWTPATQGYHTAALNAHEQKMGSVLATWRTGFQAMMFILLAAVAFTFLNHADFSDGEKGATSCRNELALKAMADIASDEKFDNVRQEYQRYIATGNVSPALQTQIDAVKAAEAVEASRKAGNENGEDQADEPVENREPMLIVGTYALKTVSKSEAQTFSAIFSQMRVPMGLRYILPVGIMGAFCALCIFLLISTDTTYLHSWSSVIVQDLILPIRGRPFTPRQQLKLLRFMIAGIAIFAFFFSYFFGQVDYILMYLAITGAIWLGGSGPCIIGGLYWKRGTTAGAWFALIAGSSLAVGGILAQQYWVDAIYPWLSNNNLLETARTMLEGASAPFEPYIKWRVTPDKFPINSQEIYAITMFVGVFLYVLVSLITCRKPYNIDRMLHRGEYQREGMKLEKEKLTLKTALLKPLGITQEYTTGDKIIAWSVFIYSFGVMFLGCFVVVAVWNIIRPWSNEGWANWFFLQNFVLAGVIGLISTVWFSVGTTVDLRRLFKRLKAKETSILDDGRVVGHVSADDVALVERVEKTTLEEARRQEQMLEEALRYEQDAENIDNLREHKHRKKDGAPPDKQTPGREPPI